MEAVSIRRDFSHHPCFDANAKHSFGRVHLPVASGCNIQCNYCNRLYGCPNENRPGVTAIVLDSDKALEYLNMQVHGEVKIAVVGIAGPGDPLCEPQRTLETLRTVHAAYPDLLLCVSTNGLNLSDYIDDLVDAGVTHVTVTVNAVDPEIGKLIYAHATIGGRIYRGIDAAEVILERQSEAVAGLAETGMSVKINTVVIPGVNSHHVTTIAREMSLLGADLMNCIAMLPLKDTPFADLEAPTVADMRRIRNAASEFILQMYHCKRCRADAAGLL